MVKDPILELEIEINIPYLFIQLRFIKHLLCAGILQYIGITSDFGTGPFCLGIYSLIKNWSMNK